MNKYQKLNTRWWDRWWNIVKHKSLTIIINKTYKSIIKKIMYFINRAHHFAIPVGMRMPKRRLGYYSFFLWVTLRMNQEIWFSTSLMCCLIWASDIDPLSEAFQERLCFFNSDCTLRANLHSTVFVACDKLTRGLQLVYNCRVCQKKHCSLWKHVLKHCDNHTCKSRHRPVIQL